MDEVGLRLRYATDERNPSVAFLGIDISKADFHACLLDGAKLNRKSFPNGQAGYRQLVQWMKNRKCASAHACMEATGTYWMGLATALHAAGFTVSVVNPSRTVMFARSQLRRTKTDVVDAEMIAQFCKAHVPEPWTPPAAEILELRGFLTYRSQLIAQRTALRQLAQQLEMNPALQKLHTRQIAELEATIESVTEQMHSLIAHHRSLQSQVDLVRSIPGFGSISAAAVVARLPIERLRDAKAAGAYAGLTPAERQSGTSIHGKPRICKTGNAELRRDLFMPALAAIRFNPALRVFAERLKAKGKPNKVIIVAVMRKLVVLAYTLLKRQTPYLDPQHA
jgi:transposase